MQDFAKFQNKIYIVSALVMLLIELISLPIHGVDWQFLIGLILGTATAILNFKIMTITSIMILNGKNKVFASLSYIIRLLLYGGVFYISVKMSLPAGIACACGIMTQKIAIFIIHGIMPYFAKDDNKNKDLRKIKQQTLINSPQWIGYAGGREVKTFKRFVEYKR